MMVGLAAPSFKALSVLRQPNVYHQRQAAIEKGEAAPALASNSLTGWNKNTLQRTRTALSGGDKSSPNT